MDSVQVSLLVLGLVFVLSVQTGYADVMCHVCNSAEEYEGKECADPFLTLKFLKNCSEIGAIENKKYESCRKVAQKVEDDYRVVRQCATRPEKGAKTDQCFDRTGTKAIKITYCECTEGGCNSANPMFSMSMLLLTISSALLALICHS